MTTKAAVQTNPSSYIGEADFQTRFDAQERLAQMVGFRLPKTRVPAGEALWDVGEQAKQALDAEVAALPSFAQGTALMRERIRQEDPKDYAKLPLQRVRMQSIAAGRDLGTPTNSSQRPMLVVEDGTNASIDLGYTDVGLGHLVDAIKPKGLAALKSNLLAISDPAIRAAVFNHHAERTHDANKAPQTLRTIVEPASGLRVLRAVTSGLHSGSTGDDLAILNAMDSQLGDSLKNAKVRITRDLERTYLEALWPAMKRQTKVGDVVLIGVRVRNSETKQGGLKIEPFVLDTLCYNFTTAESTGGDEEVRLVAGFDSIRHVGDLGKKLAEVFTRCLKKVDPFIKAFGDAYKAPATLTRGELLERVQRVYELPEAVVRVAGEVWDEQATLHGTAGDTLADLVNAMTKASQGQNMDDASVTGRAAGDLIVKGFTALD